MKGGDDRELRVALGVYQIPLLLLCTGAAVSARQGATLRARMHLHLAYFLLDPLHKQLKLRLPKLARGSPAERGFERFRSEAQSRGVQVRGTRDVDQDGLAGTVWTLISQSSEAKQAIQSLEAVLAKWANQAGPALQEGTIRLINIAQKGGLVAFFKELVDVICQYGVVFGSAVASAGIALSVKGSLILGGCLVGAGTPLIVVGAGLAVLGAGYGVGKKRLGIVVEGVGS